MAWSINDASNDRRKLKNSSAPSLSDEAKDSREASAELDTGTYSAGNEEVAAGIVRIEKIVSKQIRDNEQLLREMKKLVAGAENAIIKAREVSVFVSDDKNAMQDAILSGTGDAIKELAREAREEIEQTAKTTREHILALEKESHARTERLARHYAPSKLFTFLKWTTVILLLIMALSYLAQQYL